MEGRLKHTPAFMKEKPEAESGTTLGPFLPYIVVFSADDSS